MNQRQIDLALLAGIGVLLLAILFLAFSAAPSSRQSDIGNPAQEASQVTGQEIGPGGRVLRGADGDAVGAGAPGVSPSGAGTRVGEGQQNEGEGAANVLGETDVAESGTASDASQAEETSSTTPSAADTLEPIAATAEPVGDTGSSPEPLAGGEERLERVGFAFVTGSMGACGVPLQPWQHVAVSRDLLDRYGCGATVELTLSDEVAGRQQVRAQIGDTMGAEIAGTVNIFVAQDEPALEYGVTEGTLRALSGSQ